MRQFIPRRMSREMKLLNLRLRRMLFADAYAIDERERASRFESLREAPPRVVIKFEKCSLLPLRCEDYAIVFCDNALKIFICNRDCAGPVRLTFSRMNIRIIRRSGAEHEIELEMQIHCLIL